MANKIQFKRGLKANLPTLTEGEPGFCTDTKEVYIGSSAGNVGLVKKTGDTMTGNLSVPSINGGTPWTSANDGSGSGLDADLLDGQNSSYYTDVKGRLGYTPLNSTSYTAADVLSKIKTVDGGSSGLDADLLDGQHASSFASASHNHDTAYLGKTSKAVDSDKLAGQTAGYFTDIVARLGYTPLNTAGGVMSGGLTIGNTPNPLALKGGYGDHVYQSFFADKDNQSARSGWLGFGAVGDRSMTLYNELAVSSIQLMGTGDVAINPKVNRTVYLGGVDIAQYIRNNGVVDGDLNECINSGIYRIGVNNINSPDSATNYGQMIVMRGGGDTVTQIITDWGSGKMFWRSGNPKQAGGAGEMYAWREVYHSGNYGELVEINASRSSNKLDSNKHLFSTNTNSIVYTIENDSVANLPISSEIVITQYGAGEVTIAPSTGVTIRNTKRTIKGLDKSIVLKKIKANEWLLAGDSK